VRIVLDRPLDFRRTLGVHRTGAADPTTRLTATELWRATRTPEGPGTLHLERVGDEIHAEAWGPGASWLLDRVPGLLGEHDDDAGFDPAHRVVRDAWRDHRGLRVGRSLVVMAPLIAAIVAQRVTAVEAHHSWRSLCRADAEPAPGPKPPGSGRALVLPPDPARLALRPAWWFHPHGIESQRARTIVAACRQAHRLEGASSLPVAEGRGRLNAVPGVGPWTVAEVSAAAWGDADAVAVGDFHLKHVVVHALTGRPRGTDDEMLDLLAPFAPHRGRTIRLLLAAGARAPKRGPRQRINPIARW
jgi:3-methyladenine DNA glycosylase/8-oxoguanine DNA glycosylase